MTQTNEDLPRFDEPRVFRPKRARPQLRAVDPPGYEELHPIWPATAGGLRAYIRELNRRGECVSTQYLQKLRAYGKLAARLRALPPEERPLFLARQFRRMHRIDPDLTDEGIYDLLCEFLKTARLAVREFNDRYIPEHLQAPFTSEGKLEARTDPVEMILEIASTPTMRLDPGNERDFMHRVLLFEMRRDLVIGERLFDIWMKLQEITAGRPFEQRITEMLEGDFFTAGVQRRFNVPMLIDEETGNPLAIMGPEEQAGPGQRVVTIPMPCRYFKDTYGRELPIFFDPGQKKMEATLFKMIERGFTDPLQLHDLFRFQMVFRNERELALGIQALVERVFPMPSATSDVHDTRRDKKTDNRISAVDEYRVIYVTFRTDGYKFEGQFHDLENNVRAKTSTGPVNHRHYKERRADFVHPIINPVEIYGVDWSDSEIRRQVIGQ